MSRGIVNLSIMISMLSCNIIMKEAFGYSCENQELVEDYFIHLDKVLRTYLPQVVSQLPPLWCGQCESSCVIQNIMMNAQYEVRHHFKGETHITNKDLEGLRYVKQIIMETLRLHPPLPLLLPRLCLEPLEIWGHQVPKRADVGSYKFQTSKFANSDVEFKDNNFEFTPFGSGRRMCLAITLVSSNMKISLASLPFPFDWKIPHSLDVSTMDMSEAPEATARKKIALELNAMPHDSMGNLSVKVKQKWCQNNLHIEEARVMAGHILRPEPKKLPPLVTVWCHYIVIAIIVKYYPCPDFSSASADPSFGRLCSATHQTLLIN
ncbi:hypothetical protein EJB05_39178, partial [Eragrostis curvula]